MSKTFLRAAVIDEYLGDPEDPRAHIRGKDVVSADEAAVFPAETVDALNEWGLQRAYVPTLFGGELHDLLLTMLLTRHVARRDLTAAVAHGKTFLGALCAWLAGGDIAHRMASIVDSGAAVSWGLTESGRGSDLLRTRTHCTTDGPTRLHGGKWPVNNATRGRAMCVLVRTRTELSPRSLSLVLADKEEIDLRRVSYRPKVHTHGIKGADISGIDWDGVPLPADRFIGEPGQGLELVLKALQITRPVCTALSMGGADTAVATVLTFLSDRRLYGRRLVNLPGATADAGAIVADALIAEATAMVGARHVTAYPEEMGLVSALVKYIVPATVDALFRNATRFLGARSQLIGPAHAGVFQKAARDNRVVGIFDGNSVVNLNAIINEFGAIARGARREIGDLPPLAALDPGVESPGLDFGRLRLHTKAGSTLLRAIPSLASTARRNASPELARAIEVFRDAAAEVSGEVSGAGTTAKPGAAHFELAQLVAETFAGACCLLVRTGNTASSSLARDDTWAVAALGRVCERLGRPLPDTTSACRALAGQALESNRRGEPTTLFEGWYAA
ncbi:acyl-CoA dehydrogenase family protein [Sphaerimonospora mesophila]|uniref:acyl-CoA dehydrogenase family protein n=1 Tax=Sphaerimonospora mesophila TaxID=37483 RepID=UPI0006E40989